MTEEQNHDLGDEIYKLLHSFRRDIHKPDLHSFQAYIKNGSVYVECRQSDVFIQEYYNNGKENRWGGTYIAAANRLEMLGLQLDTIDI